MTTTERAKRSYAVYQLARNIKGMTDYKVSQAAGIRPSSLSDWKSGRYTPKYETLRKVANVLDIPVELFLKED